MTSPALWWFCYRIDPAFTSPREMNDRWRAKHQGGRFAELFHVREPSEAHGLGHLGRSNDHGEWWFEPGGGCSLLVADDEERDRVLLSFFIEHIESFDKVTYGPVDESPNSHAKTRVVLIGRDEIARGEAA